MTKKFYMFSRSAIYSGAEKMLLTLAEAVKSSSEDIRIYLSYSCDDFNKESLFFDKKKEPNLERISNNPLLIIKYFFIGSMHFFKSVNFGKESLVVFNDFESLIINWPIALFNRSYFYLHDSHKLSRLKGRLVCNIISFLVDEILVITNARVKMLKDIGIYNTIYLPNCSKIKVEVGKIERTYDEIHCVCISQIAGWKRIDKSIELFEKLADFNIDKTWYLHILGKPFKGDLSGIELEKYIIGKSNLDSRIIYHGYSDKVSDFYLKSNFVISMSINEPFGLVLVEALRHGCYIISSEGEGPNEIVDSEFIGKIINESDDISDWVEKNNLLINEMAVSGVLDRISSSERFNYDNYVNKISEILKKVN